MIVARQIRMTAGTTIALHIAGLAFAAVALRPGTAVYALDVRAAYVAARPLGWSIGWGVWAGCALSFVAFLFALARHTQERPFVALLAVMLATAGAAVDIAAGVVWVFVLPAIGAGISAPEPVPAALYVAVERSASAIGLLVANVFYSGAILCGTLAIRTRVSRIVIGTGIATFVAGIALAIAGATGDPWLVEIAAGPVILLFCLWAGLVAWKAPE